MYRLKLEPAPITHQSTFEATPGREVVGRLSGVHSVALFIAMISNDETFDRCRDTDQCSWYVLRWMVRLEEVVENVPNDDFDEVKE